MSRPRRLAASAVTSALAVSVTLGQNPSPSPPASVAGIPVNYDEALAGAYTLPDPLVLQDGKPVRDARTWYEKRRPEIMRLFEESQFGKSPDRPRGMSFCPPASPRPRDAAEGGDHCGAFVLRQVASLVAFRQDTPGEVSVRCSRKRLRAGSSCGRQLSTSSPGTRGRPAIRGTAPANRLPGSCRPRGCRSRGRRPRRRGGRWERRPA